MMDFYHVHGDAISHRILEARSLLLMKAKARYEWKHGIAALKSGKIAGQTIRRRHRASLTFRKVLLA